MMDAKAMSPGALADVLRRLDARVAYMTAHAAEDGDYEAAFADGFAAARDIVKAAAAGEHLEGEAAARRREEVYGDNG